MVCPRSIRGNQLTKVLIACVASLILLVCYRPLSHAHAGTRYNSFAPFSSHESAPGRSGPQIPPGYALHVIDSEWCESKYDIAYITSFGRQTYCDPSRSDSFLDCFSTQITDERKDIFCIAGKTSLVQKSKKPYFEVDCTPWTSENTNSQRATLNAYSFPRYMYDTGPYFIFHEHISVRSGAASEHSCTYGSSSSRYILLVKREGEGNLWHSLLEIFSLYLTIDVMRVTPRDPSEPNGEPLLPTADINSTQVVILDEHPEGPFYELWKLFAPLPVVRSNDFLSTHIHRCFEKIVIPLAGGSNPLWQGDWDAGACTHSQLLDTFVERILSQHGLESSSRSTPADSGVELTLTFIDRRSSRVLINATKHLNDLRQRFPMIKLQACDFAAISFGEQLRIIRSTDILVGVHGAGMTHSMFLPPESSVVEILPHNLDYKVYRNLAKLKGHKYFSAHAEPGMSSDWHDLDVEIHDDRFIELVEAGIRAVLHKGSRAEDVV